MYYIDHELQLKETQKPIPKDNEVLIRICAFGINRPDIYQRKGQYPAPKDASPILGLEVAGIVEHAPSSSSFKKGDAVMALTHGGGYAEYVCVDTRHCLPKPQSLSFAEAAALPETLFTVWANLYVDNHLPKGAIVLIHAGSSGIGSIAIQIAKYWQCKVITTCAGNKIDFCQQLGADLVINRETQDFVAITKKAFGGADYILDMLGGGYMERNIATLKPKGRLININYMLGANIELNFMPIMLKRLIITASTLRSRSTEEKAEIAQSIQKYLMQAIEAREIIPIIDKYFKASDIENAHQYMESNQHKGKIVAIWPEYLTKVE